MPLATPSLFLEYEDVLKRPEQRAMTGLTLSQIGAALVDQDEAMSRATYPLKLPNSIKAAARLAKQDGVSLNQWIAAAVLHRTRIGSGPVIGVQGRYQFQLTILPRPEALPIVFENVAAGPELLEAWDGKLALRRLEVWQVPSACSIR